MSRCLELRNVVKEFSAGEIVRAVDGVSLTAAPGQFIALYGPSGSGKSTLLKLAGGYLLPDSGDVLFDGRDVAAFSARVRARYQRRDVGYVQQTIHATDASTALDNAAVKLLADRVSLAEARIRAKPWLVRVGLEHRLDHTAGQLSGGELQRVALARALVNEPAILLADEPTAHLDRRRAAAILSLIAEISRDNALAVLLATHDPDAAAHANQVYELRDGRIESAHGSATTTAMEVRGG